MQGHIDSALAGIKIIVETIAPWQSTLALLEQPDIVNAALLEFLDEL